ncbi:MAG: hypothetical protein ACRCTW_07685 [Lactococcus garvieae]
MKIINFDALVENEAIIIINGAEHVIKEPTLAQWAEFQKLDIDRKLKEEPMPMYCYMISQLCPSILLKGEDGLAPMDNMTGSDLNMLIKVLGKLYYEGVESIGKKTRPLDEIVEIVDPVALNMKHILT